MNESMLERLKTMENRYEELGHMLMDPDIGSDIKKMTDVTKEQASSPICISNSFRPSEMAVM